MDSKERAELDNLRRELERKKFVIANLRRENERLRKRITYYEDKFGAIRESESDTT